VWSFSDSGKIHTYRRQAAQGRVAGGPPGDRQDPDGPGRAGESGVPFFIMSLRIREMFVAWGGRVRDLFQQAKPRPVHCFHREFGCARRGPVHRHSGRP
jgi:hypothetical protein